MRPSYLAFLKTLIHVCLVGKKHWDICNDIGRTFSGRNHSIQTELENTLITDAFFRRYPARLVWTDEPSRNYQSFLEQSAQIIFVDLSPKLNLTIEFFRDCHDALCREIGIGSLNLERNYDAKCGEFLNQKYDLWNNAHGTPDQFLKYRLSLIEIILQRADRFALEMLSSVLIKPKRNWLGVPAYFLESSEFTNRLLIENAIIELNKRFKQTGLPFHFHNGMIQSNDDQLLQDLIATPCWEILNNPIFRHADLELKTALDRADNGYSDAAFYAAKSLESVIKIICSQKEWNVKEGGGVSLYIDQLQSKNNGDYITGWEADNLKWFFSNIRNPQAHGTGTKEPLQLTAVQQKWAIDFCMSWIKSLVSRM